MDLTKLFGGPSAAPTKLRRTFPIVIQRRSGGLTLSFDAQVDGYFVGRGGRPEFIAETITVRGIPNMNIRTFLPDELKEIRRYALSEEYPRLLAGRL